MTAGPAQVSILHCDLDAFYASVEQLDRPELRGRPVIVGGTSNRGVVAAASYEARVFGVHSALPIARARRLCPHGEYVFPRFERYQEKSREVFAILRSFTPLVEPLASDEAFLDVSGAHRLFGSGPEIAHAVKQRVKAETGLTISVGAATTKLLAKLASDLSKPDGLLVVEAGTELAFLHPLPVQRLWGVGPATLERLARLGITTVGDLAATEAATLVKLLGDVHGRHLHALAHNRDPRPVDPDVEGKSIGSESTFAHDLLERRDVERETLRLADLTAARLRKASRAGRTVTLKVRWSDFHTVTRSSTLSGPTDSSAVIARTALELVRAVDTGDGIRLLGVSVANFGPAGAEQASLFSLVGSGDTGGDVAEGPSGPLAADPLDAAVDGLRARFGSGVIDRAAMLARTTRPSDAEQNVKTSPPDADDSVVAGDDGHGAL
jgi:DNA polymerase IV